MSGLCYKNIHWFVWPMFWSWNPSSLVLSVRLLHPQDSCWLTSVFFSFFINTFDLSPLILLPFSSSKCLLKEYFPVSRFRQFLLSIHFLLPLQRCRLYHFIHSKWTCSHLPQMLTLIILSYYGKNCARLLLHRSCGRVLGCSHDFISTPK